MLSGRARNSGSCRSSAVYGLALGALIASLSPVLGAAQAEQPRLGPQVSRRALSPQSVAGMTLEIRQGRVVVASVTPGSGAATVGLLPGDTILEVNGRSLVDLDPISPEMALGLFEAGGSGELRLVVGRGAGTLGVNLPLRTPDEPPGALPSPNPLRLGAVAP